MHFSNDVRKFKLLDLFSNLPFEIYLGQPKKLIRKSFNVLPQIISRPSEKQNVNINNTNLTISDFKLSKIKQTNEIFSSTLFWATI